MSKSLDFSSSRNTNSSSFMRDPPPPYSLEDNQSQRSLSHSQRNREKRRQGYQEHNDECRDSNRSRNSFGEDNTRSLQNQCCCSRLQTNNQLNVPYPVYTHTNTNCRYPTFHNQAPRFKDEREREYEFLRNNLTSLYLCLQNDADKITREILGSKYKLFEIEPCHIWHYRITTFRESREETIGMKPFRSGDIDRTKKRRPLDSKWDLQIPIHQNNEKTYSVLGTEKVVTCRNKLAYSIRNIPVRFFNFINDQLSERESSSDLIFLILGLNLIVIHSSTSSPYSRMDLLIRCTGKGKIDCSRCDGKGRHHCHSCHGIGRVNKTERRTVTTFVDGEYKQESESFNRSAVCHCCGGMGDRNCDFCYGYCKSTCKSCFETGKMMTYQQITVKWKPVSDHHFSESCISQGHLKQCEGLHVCQTAQSQTNKTLIPFQISECLNQEMEEASKNLVTKHSFIPFDSVIRKQEHFVEMIPAFKITAEKHSRSLFHKKSIFKEFWVAGTDRVIYNPGKKRKGFRCS